MNIKIDDVKRATAIFYHSSRAQMEGPSRQHRWAWPRQVAMALSRRYTTRSLVEIGHRFGGRDHSTVHNAIRVLTVRYSQEADIRAEISSLCAQIEAGAISQCSAWAEQWDRSQTADPYGAMLAQRGRLFSMRVAEPATALMRDMPGPRVLLLRGPNAMACEAAA